MTGSAATPRALSALSVAWRAVRWCVFYGGCSTTRYRRRQGVHGVWKSKVVYVDDLDGEPIDAGLAQTIRFSVDGVCFEIDLRPAHAERWRREVAGWICGARRIDPAVSRRERSATSGAAVPRVDTRVRRDRYQLAAVRAWAKSQGIVVNSRGRVPVAVLERFDAAHARPGRGRVLAG